MYVCIYIYIHTYVNIHVCVCLRICGLLRSSPQNYVKYKTKYIHISYNIYIYIYIKYITKYITGATSVRPSARWPSTTLPPQRAAGA